MSASANSIPIAIFGLDEKSAEALRMAFAGPGKGRCAIVDEEKAAVAILNMDYVGAEQVWKRHVELFPSRPLIALSVTPPSVPNVIHVAKPVRLDLLLEAIESAYKAIPREPPKRVAPSASKPLDPPKSAAPAPVPPTPAADREIIEIKSRFAQNTPPPAQTAANATAAPANTSHYSPEEFLQGRLFALRKLAIESGVPAGMTVKAGDALIPIIINANEQRIITPLSDDRLQTLCGTPVWYLGIKTLRASEIDALLKEGKTQDIQHLESFFWKVALWTSGGKVPLGVDLRASIKLRRWPNLTRLPETPNAMRIAALMMEQPRSLPLIAKVLQVPPREVFDFYSATWSVGLVEGVTYAAQSAHPPPDTAPPPPPPQRNLFGRIMQKLRGSA